MNMESSVMCRKAWFLLGLMFCGALAVATMPRYSVAQEEKEKPAAAAPAAGGEKAAAGEEKPAAGAPAEPQVENFLIWVM